MKSIVVMSLLTSQPEMGGNHEPSLPLPIPHLAMMRMMLAVGITERGRQDTLTYRAHSWLLTTSKSPMPDQVGTSGFPPDLNTCECWWIDISVLHVNPSDYLLVEIRISFFVWCSFKAILAHCNLEPWGPLHFWDLEFLTWPLLTQVTPISWLHTGDLLIHLKREILVRFIPT